MVTTFETILRGFSHSANSHSKVKFWAFRYYPHLRGWEGYNAMKLEQSIKEAWDNEGRAPWSTPTYEYRPEDSNG